MHRYFNDILKQVDENYVEKKVSVKQKPSVEEIELVEDLELEFPEEEIEQSQNLFDGYLGEQREVPNPLEYGPNATYRNLREGVVYKKGPDNLWEMFVKDGQNGKQGAAGGSGTGVNEVKQIVNDIRYSQITRKTLITPSTVCVASPTEYGPAYGFVNRFMCPHDKCFGFDIVWFNSVSATPTISASRWSIAPDMISATSQVNPLTPKVNGLSVDGSTISSGNGQYNTGFLISDFIPKTISVGQIVEVRTNMLSGSKSFTTASQDNLDTSLFPNILLASYLGSSTGDCISTNPALACRVSAVQAVCFVRWYCVDNNKISVLWVGDSTVAGSGGSTYTVGFQSPLYVASKLDPKISTYVYGSGGKSSYTSVDALKLIVSKLNPELVIITSWSPNDGISVMEQSIQNCFYAANYCLTLGKKVIVTTPWPWEGKADGVNYGTWYNGVQMVRNLCRNNPTIGLLDCAEILEQPGTGILKPEYKGTSSTVEVANHANEQARIALASGIVDAVNKSYMLI